MVLPPRLDPGCLMLPCLAKSQFNFFFCQFTTGLELVSEFLLGQ